MTLTRLIIALLGFNLLLTLGAGLFNYSLYSALRGSETPAKAAVDSTGYGFYTIEKIIFNIQEAKREHYFVLDLALQTDMEFNKERVKQFEPLVRNSVVSHLSQMNFSQLRGLPIAELQARLEAALFDDFSSKQLEIPFSAVLVSKMIVQ